MFSKTLRTTLAATLLVSGGAFAGTSAMAQDELVAKKMENVEFLEMTLVRYHSGKMGRAAEMIKKHFAPASKKAGTPVPWVMHFETGRWDAVEFWDLKGGYGDMEWQLSPNGVKFVTALREQEGGKEQAAALFKEYRSLVAERDVFIGHHHKAKKEE